jgi:serine/threonine protein kinase
VTETVTGSAFSPSRLSSIFVPLSRYGLRRMDATAPRSSKSGAPPAMGRYVPFARLGNGGMADVFLALARGPAGFNKLTVVKRLRNYGDDLLVGMFLDEARLSARLSHPNIVNTYEVGEADGRFFIAMEYLEGQPLQAANSLLSGSGGGISDSLAAFIAMQALKGLHYAHELADYDGTKLGVVHRDVSPHNIFLTYGGEVKLLDFGIAKAAVNSTQTATGVLKGKVRYMAPEQVEELNIDRRADIYALGIVLWETLARRPLHSGDQISILTRIASVDPPLVSTVRPEIPAELEAIVSKALRRGRDERYATADEMRVDLERFLRERSETGLDTELARLMDKSFADTRDAVRARIKSHLAMLSDGPVDSMSGVSRLVQSLNPLPPLFGDGSGASVPASARRSSAPARQGTTEAPAAERARWPLAAGGLLLLGVVGALVLRGMHAPAAATSAVESPPPSPLPAIASAHLRIETAPSAALVEWNGKPIDRTPADVDLPPGHQTITLSLEGYESEEVVVDAEAGKPLARALVLRAKAAAVALAPSPPPAAALASPPPPAHAWPHRRPAPHGPVATTPATAPTAPPAASARTKIRVIGDETP